MVDGRRGHEHTRELCGSKSNVRSSHIGQPVEATDNAHVGVTASAHNVVFVSAFSNGHRREVLGIVKRAVKGTHIGSATVRLKLLE